MLGSPRIHTDCAAVSLFGCHIALHLAALAACVPLFAAAYGCAAVAFGFVGGQTVHTEASLCSVE